MPVTSKDEAIAREDFYESMFDDIAYQNMQLRGTPPMPWEIIMYYVGALEERVKALEKGNT